MKVDLDLKWVNIVKFEINKEGTKYQNKFDFEK
jgi:hypothetical protein